jgi:hypothetical protein
MGKKGRPTKRTASYRRAIIETVNKGHGLTSAAKACGISPRLITLWRSEDPEFRRECDEAREYCADVVELRLFSDAMRGSTLAQLAYLRARRPEYYRARTVIQGDPDSPVSITHSIGNKPRIVVLPDNSRPSLSAEQMQSERIAIERQDMIGNDTSRLLEVVAEVAVEADDAEVEVEDEPVAAESSEFDAWPIKRRIS